MQDSKHTKLKLDELQRDSVETFKTKQKTQICLLLDDIRSLNNVGSSFRTADAFALEKICVNPVSVGPPVPPLTVSPQEMIDPSNLRAANAALVENIFEKPVVVGAPVPPFVSPQATMEPSDLRAANAFPLEKS